MVAVFNMPVCRSSLSKSLPCMFLRCFPNDFEIVPVVPIITGITFVSIIRYMIINFFPQSTDLSSESFPLWWQKARRFGVNLLFSVYLVKAVWQMLAESTIAVLFRMFITSKKKTSGWTGTVQDSLRSVLLVYFWLICQLDWVRVKKSLFAIHSSV
jgi:hypothetical protein